MAGSLDGTRLAVLSARFDGIARKMANTLQRTGRSGILTIARDFSCVILTARHELLATAESLPIHVLRGPDTMARTMVENHPVQGVATRSCTTRPITAARIRPTTRS